MLKGRKRKLPVPSSSATTIAVESSYMPMTSSKAAAVQPSSRSAVPMTSSTSAVPMTSSTSTVPMTSSTTAAVPTPR